MKKRAYVLVLLIIGMFFSNVLIASAASVEDTMLSVMPLVNALKSYYDYEDRYHKLPYDVNLIVRYEISKKVLKNTRETYYTSPENMQLARANLIIYKNNNKDFWYPKEDEYIDRELSFIQGLLSGTNIDLSQMADRDDALYTSDGLPIIKINDAIQGTIYTDDSPKALERGLSELLNNTSIFFMTYLKKWGADIDTLVYNSSADYRLERRIDVNGEPFYYQFGSKSFFIIDFEDASNSPFSSTSMTMYHYFHYFALILMVSVLMLLGIRLMSNGITKNKVDFKQTVTTYVFSYVLIFAFPYIMKIITIFLNQLITMFRPESGGGSFVGTMAEVATNTMRFSDALLLLGCVGISIYFLFIYASRALHIMLFYALFPIMVMFMNGQNMKDNFQRYIKDFFATLFVQLIDAILFWSVSIAFRLGGTTMATAPGLLKIFVVCSIITVRSFLKDYLSEGRSMKSELMGISALMGISRLVTGVARGVGGSVKNVAGGINDFASSFKVNPSTATSGAGADADAGAGASAGMGEAPSQGNTGVYQNAATIRSTGRSVFEEGNEQGFTSTSSAARIVKTGDGKYSVVKNESQEEMLRKLRIQGLRSIGRGTMSLAGGGIGASMGAGMASYLGPTAMIYGANMGGVIGYGLGNGLGNLAGSLAGSAYNTTDYIARHKPASNSGIQPQGTGIVVRDSGELSATQGNAQSMGQDPYISWGNFEQSYQKWNADVESGVRVYAIPYEGISPYARTVDQHLNDRIVRDKVQSSSNALPGSSGLQVSHTHEHNVSAGSGDMTVYINRPELDPQTREFKDACYSNFLGLVGSKEYISDFNEHHSSMNNAEKFQELSKRAIFKTCTQYADEYSVVIDSEIINEITHDINSRLRLELRDIRDLQNQIDSERFVDMDSL